MLPNISYGHIKHIVCGLKAHMVYGLKAPPKLKIK